MPAPSRAVPAHIAGTMTAGNGNAHTAQVTSAVEAITATMTMARGIPIAAGGYGERGFLERASDEVASWLGDEDAERRRELDQHRGKGPKGYTRSDARIQEDVSDRLSDEGMLDASDIAVSVTNGEVQLSGLVDSKWAKRRAEDCAEAVSGVKHVQNNLRIRPSGGSPGWNAGNTDRNIA
ncbi:osmotically-inducible protein OsmY [Sinorhizobium meliloti]